jgi:hypothetical protein
MAQQLASQLGDYAAEIAVALGLITALVAAVRRPARWVGRRLVKDPMSAWLRRVVGEEVDARTVPMQAELAAFRQENREQHDAMHCRLDELEDRVLVVEQPPQPGEDG